MDAPIRTDAQKAAAPGLRSRDRADPEQGSGV